MIEEYLHSTGLEMREIKQKTVIGGEEASLTIRGNVEEEEEEKKKGLGNDIMGFAVWPLPNCYRWEGPAIEICQ